MEPKTNSLPYGNSGNYSLIRDYLRKLIGGGVKSPFDMIRESPWMPNPQPNSDITTRPISNQIGPGFGQPMPSNRLFDIIKGLMPGSSDPTRATQPVVRESNPWTPDGGYEYQPMPTRRTNPSWGLSPINKNLVPSYPAFPSTPGGSVQPSLPRQPRISQEDINTKPIASWM